MKTIFIQYFKTKIGELILGSYDNKLCLLDYRYRKMRRAVDARIMKGLDADFVEQDNELLAETRKQIAEYLTGERREFSLPLLPVGTEFQQKVWAALLELGYGHTSSYLELAKKMGDEKSVRAVASANGANALALVIPCHRIIGSKGELVGYAGGLAVKKRLLIMEKQSLPFMTIGD